MSQKRARSRSEPGEHRYRDQQQRLTTLDALLPPRARVHLMQKTETKPYTALCTGVSLILCFFFVEQDSEEDDPRTIFRKKKRQEIFGNSERDIRIWNMTWDACGCGWMCALEETVS